MNLLDIFSFKKTAKILDGDIISDELTPTTYYFSKTGPEQSGYINNIFFMQLENCIIKYSSTLKSHNIAITAWKNWKIETSIVKNGPFPFGT